MKRLRPKLLLPLLLLLFLCACGTGQSADNWREQYDLGVRYLSEGNYEQAVVAFTAAIEIDPKRVEAYKAAAECYVAMGDSESAVTLLSKGANAAGSQELASLLEELSFSAQPQALSLPEVPAELTDIYIEPGEDGMSDMVWFQISWVPEKIPSDISEKIYCGRILTQAEPFTDSDILERLESYPAQWRQYGWETERTFPLSTTQGFELSAQDTAATFPEVHILFVSVDQNYEPVGYSILSADIPYD